MEIVFKELVYHMQFFLSLLNYTQLTTPGSGGVEFESELSRSEPLWNSFGQSNS